MDNVFVVTQGCYSDYHIVAIFDDEEVAKKQVGLLNNVQGRYGDEAHLETYALNTKNFVPSWLAWSKKNSIEVDWVTSSESYAEDPKNIVTKQVTKFNNPNKDYMYRVFVNAKDEATATKIAADLFRQFKAENND